MRIAIIGPTHPYKGGIVQHTTELAHRLTAAGHEVEVIGWKHQYPFFYPGKQFVDEPELPVHKGTKRVLSWRNPAGWAKWGRKLKGFDRIIMVWWVPTFQGPPYLSMLKMLGRKRPPVTLIVHNILAHEPKPADRKLVRAMLKQVDQIIVHSRAQAELTSGFTDKPLTLLQVPISLLPVAKKRRGSALRRELLFFGFVRPYKGVDVLLRALARVPADIKLVIAGEIWGDPKIYTDLIDELGLKQRVTLRNGYMSDKEMAELVAAADVAVLPYKSGTASLNSIRSFAYGTPVIATRVGSLSDQIHDGVDGLLCEPDDADALAATIKHFYEPGVADKLRKGVPRVPIEEEWQAYVKAVTAD